VLERGRGLLGRLADLRDDFADHDVTTVRIALTAMRRRWTAEQAVSALSLFSCGWTRSS
jgi:hypothetical protein